MHKKISPKRCPLLGIIFVCIKKQINRKDIRTCMQLFTIILSRSHNNNGEYISLFAPFIKI